MLTALAARVDRKIAEVIFERARRRWPLLYLLPKTWVRALITPAATLARRDLSRAVLGGLMIAGALLLLGGSA